MPCQYYTDDEKLRMAVEAQHELRAELDRLSALLCEACAKSEPEAGTPLAAWWAKHKTADAKREAADRKHTGEVGSDVQMRAYREKRARRVVPPQ